MRNQKTLTALAAVFLAVSAANAAPSSLTYQGRIVTPSGSALEASSVDLTVRILSPGSEECVLFEETHHLDMTNSDGVFSIDIGSGSRSGDDAGLTLAQVFTNSGSRTGLTCASGSSYAPAAADARNMFVSFDSGSGPVTFSTPYVIRSVPFAMEADSLAGYSAGNLCRVADAGVPQAVSPLTSANFTDLMALINGTSAKYAKASTAAGTSVAVVSGNPSTPASGSLWIDSASGVLKFQTGSTIKTLQVQPSAYTFPSADGTNGQVLTTDGSGVLSWQTPSSGGGGTLSSVGLSLPSMFSVSGSPLTADGSITATLASQTAKTFLAAPTGSAGAPSFRTIAAADLPSIDASTGLTGTLAVANGGTGATSASAARTALGTAASGSNGDITSTSALTSISSTTSAISIAPTGNLNLSPSLAVVSSAQVAAPLGTASAPSFTNSTAMATGMYFPTSTSLGFTTAGANRMIIDASGNVGIGTASPAQPLEVNGQVKARNFGASSTAAYNTAMSWYLSSANADEKWWDWYQAGGSLQLRAMNDAYSVSSTAIGLSRTSGSVTMVTFPNGNVGVGTTSPSSRLHVSASSAATSGAVFGQRLDFSPAPSSAATGQFRAYQAGIDYAGTGNSSGSLIGYGADVTHSGSGTLAELNGFNLYAANTSGSVTTNALGVNATVFSSGAGGITNATGAYFSVTRNGTGNVSSATGGSFNVTNTVAGTITTAMGGNFSVTNPGGTVNSAMGIFIGQVEGTSKWSIWANDTTAPSYFGGAIGIGTWNIASNAKLEVAGHISNSGAAATVTSCGTSPSISGNDTRGKVTTGSGTVNSCQVTFNAAFATSPYCVVTLSGTSAVSLPSYAVSTSTSAMVVYFSASYPSKDFSYICMQ